MSYVSPYWAQCSAAERRVANATRELTSAVADLKDIRCGRETLGELECKAMVLQAIADRDNSTAATSQGAATVARQAVEKAREYR